MGFDLSSRWIYYYLSPSQTTGQSPFKIVYCKNPIAPVVLAPLLTPNCYSNDVEEQAKEIKKLHDKVRIQISWKTEWYQQEANKFRKQASFKEGVLVWIYLGMERFPPGPRGKLKLRADWSFKVLEGIGGNAYKIELSRD